jgi:hypothetical protein
MIDDEKYLPFVSIHSFRKIRTSAERLITEQRISFSLQV